jgi:hypothetical protein
VTRTIAGREVIFWRNSAGELVAGSMYRWHRLALTKNGDQNWMPYRAHDDGVQLWVGLQTVGEDPTNRPALAARHPLSESVSAVIAKPGICEPEDVSANMCSWSTWRSGLAGPGGAVVSRVHLPGQPDDRDAHHRRRRRQQRGRDSRDAACYRARRPTPHYGHRSHDRVLGSTWVSGRTLALATTAVGNPAYRSEALGARPHVRRTSL